MCSAKRVGLRMGPSGTPSLNGNWIFLWRLPIQNNLKPSNTKKRRNKVKYLIWMSIRLKSVKKTSRPNPVKGLGYIKFYSSKSPGLVKMPGNFIRYNSQRICSWSRRPKTRLEIRKKMSHFSGWSTTLLLTGFWKSSTENKKTKTKTSTKTNHRRLTRWWFSDVDLSPTFLNTGATDETFQKSEKQDSFWHILKIWYSPTMYQSSGSQFLEPPLECNQDQMPLMNQGLWPF